MPVPGVLAPVLRHWPLFWGIGGSAALVVALGLAWAEGRALWRGVR